MRPRMVATLAVVAALVALAAGTTAWNEWRTSRMERLPIGASKADVIAALGKPDNTAIGSAFAGCGTSTSECWTWKLVGQNYLSVCFDRSGRVLCHEAFSIWT